MRQLFNIVVLVYLLCCVCEQSIYSQALYDFPDVHVFSTTNPQSEVHISVNPTNDNSLILSCNTYPGYHSQGYFYSMDGGTTWNGSENLEGYTTLQGDPSTAFDAGGNGYLSTLNGGGNGILMQSSNNNGANWNNISDPINNESGTDKEMIASDNYSTSPFHDNLYCGWTYFYGGASSPLRHVLIDHSTNGGQSFIDQFTINSNGSGVNLQTNPNGTVYAVWADYGSSATYPASGMGFSYSSNGGQSFSPPVIAFPYTGIDVDEADPDPTFNYIRINDFPSMAVDKSCVHPGRLYIVYPEEISSSSFLK